MDEAWALLFVYGTLSDPEIRARVVGPCPPARAARLRDHELRQADGFYFVRARTNRHVDGWLLRLSHEQLSRADAWEEVPVYRRQRVCVECAEEGASSWAWVYVRDIEGAPVEAPGIAALGREAILDMLDLQG